MATVMVPATYGLRYAQHRQRDKEEMIGSEATSADRPRPPSGA